MKKVFGSIFVAMLCLTMFANSSFAACSWSSWVSYTLTDQNTYIIVEFDPGVDGSHEVEVDFTAPLTTVRTQIDWWSDADPSWHNFIDTWYPDTHGLFAGSDDVKFRIMFSKNQMRQGDYFIKWRYCTDY